MDLTLHVVRVGHVVHGRTILRWWVLLRLAAVPGVGQHIETVCGVIGVVLMVVFLTINSALVRKLIKLERQRTTISDKRAQAVSHFVEASRPLKLNGWTATWSARIMKFRAMEMAKRLSIAHVSAAISTVSVTGGTSYPLASIAAAHEDMAHDEHFGKLILTID